MRLRLTSINVPKLAPPEGTGRAEYEDQLCPGLVLRISRGARRITRTWLLVFYRRRKKVRLLLGYYQKPGERAPFRRRDAPLLGLEEARTRAVEMLKRADRGIDAAAQRSLGSVADLVESCIAAKAHLGEMHKKPCRPATLANWQRDFKGQIKTAPFADTPASDLQRSEVRLWLAPIIARAPHIATSSLRLLKMAYNWATRNEMMPASPLGPIVFRAGRSSPSRFLNVQELRAIWLALAELRKREHESIARRGRLHLPYADVAALLLLTGVRRRMVLEMRRADIELEGSEPKWMIDASSTKGHRTHVVPLSPQAVAIIKPRLAENSSPTYVFPKVASERPMGWSPRWVREQLKAVTQDVYFRLTATRLPEERARVVIANWTIHELRHTIRTHLCGSLKISDDVARLILMHKRAGMDAIYNLAELLDERRAALVAWGAWLDQLIAKRKAADVVSISRSRRR